MYEIGTTLLVFVLLLISTAIGVIVRPLLPEEHKAHETVQLVQLVITMLVTFAALVLGLMTASAKTHFDTVSNDFRGYSADLIQLDTILRDDGPEADGARRILRAYTAAAIASTWPAEQAPAGNYYPKSVAPTNDEEELENFQLGDLLDSAGREIRRLTPRDTVHQNLLNTALAQFERTVQGRWALLEEAHSSISTPFLTMLTFWMVVIFLSFGLIAPRNVLAIVTITLGALSIASAIYVIVDLDSPFSGPIVVSSQPMRNALAHLSR